MAVIGGGLWLLASLLQRVFNPYHYDGRPWDELSLGQQQRLGKRWTEEQAHRRERELARQEQRRLAWIAAGRP